MGEPQTGEIIKNIKVNHKMLLPVLSLLLVAAACTFSPQITPTASQAATTSESPAAQAPPPNPGLEDIFIQMPGPGSQVASPLLVEGFAGPTFEQNLVVIVSDANGGILALEAAIIQADIGLAGPFSASLVFAVSQDQPGRISVYHQSARDGGLVHLASAPVTLLASDDPSLTVEDNEMETIHIDEPGFLVEIEGGELVVSGYSEYFFEANLSVTLCGSRAGGEQDLVCGTMENLLAQGYATIDSPDIGMPGPFNGTLSYSVEEPTRGRVVVYALSPMDGRIEHLSSVEVMLLP